MEDTCIGKIFPIFVGMLAYLNDKFIGNTHLKIAQVGELHTHRCRVLAQHGRREPKMGL